MKLSGLWKGTRILRSTLTPRGLKFRMMLGERPLLQDERAVGRLFRLKRAHPQATAGGRKQPQAAASARIRCFPSLTADLPNPLQLQCENSDPERIARRCLRTNFGVDASEVNFLKCCE